MKILTKKLVAVLLTLCILFSGIVTAFAASGTAADYALLIDNSAGTGYGQLYLHEVGMTSPNLPAGDYTIEFDFYTLQADSTDLPLQISNSDWSGNALSQKWINVSSTVGEWNTISKDVTTTGTTGYPWFYVGAGLKGYMDNFKIISKSTGEVVLNLEFTADDLGKTSKSINTVVALPTDVANAKPVELSDDYAILVDNTANTGYIEIYFHELGLASPSAPAGTYTVEYDFYALSVGNKAIHYGASKTDWSGNAIGQVWKENLPLAENEWVTISFTATATDIVGYQKLWIGAGIKGYMDNFKLTASDGTVYTNFEMTAAELGKTSKSISTVVAMPLDVADAKNSEEPENPEPTADYMLLVDTTALDNGAVKDFWFNTLGMANHNNTLTSGKSYTITFDVYPAQMPDGNNLFHYRTSNGSASSNAGWWGSNLEVGKWQTTSNTFTVGDNYGNHILYVYGGFKGYIDNLRLVDENGNEVASTFTDFNGLTVPTNYADYLKIDAFVLAEFLGAQVAVGSDLSMKYYVNLDGVSDLSNVVVKFTLGTQTTEVACNKESVVGENYVFTFENIPPQAMTETITTEVFLNGESISAQHKYSIQQNLENLLADNPSAELKQFITDMLYYGAAAQNYRGYNTDKLATSVDGIGSPSTATPIAPTDYALLIDNTAGTGYGQLYLHEVGMTSPNLPAGDYTIEFDFYTLQANSTDLPLQISNSDWSGNALSQKWINVSSTVGEWNTISKDVTTTGTTGYPWFYVGAGLKGYMDNFKIISKSTGEVCLNLEFTADDLGKTSKGINTVVALPQDVADAKNSEESDYMLLVDTTALDNNSVKDFWFNNFGMSNHYNALTSGKNYTITFDVYPVQMPDGNNLFHYRTSNGSDSSNAGWWGSDLEVGKWQTTSNTFNVSDASKSGNHILYVYGGFKGYIDNLRLVDENGNDVASTFTDFNSLTVSTNYADYLTIKTDKNVSDFKFLYNNSATVNFRSANVYFDAANSIIVRVNNRTESTKVYVRKIGDTTRTELVYNAALDGYKTAGITATNFATEYVFEIEDSSNGGITPTLTYSINRYVVAKWNSAKISELVKALYRYGISAKAYAATIE